MHWVCCKLTRNNTTGMTRTCTYQCSSSHSPKTRRSRINQEIFKIRTWFHKLYPSANLKSAKDCVWWNAQGLKPGQRTPANS